jgi:hypothetical protein
MTYTSTVEGTFNDLAKLRRFAEAAIGQEAWRGLRSNGKVASGPHAGSYVSALPHSLVMDMLGALLQGKVLNIQLMHRSDGGQSKVALVKGRLTMVFMDRTEEA